MPKGDEGRNIFAQFLRVVFLVQLTLGISQLICGGLAVRFIEGAKDSYRILMLIGVFIVAISMAVSGMISLVTGRRTAGFNSNSRMAVSNMECLLCSLHGLCISTICGSCLTVVSVILSGAKDCDPTNCSFTEPFTGKKIIVILILTLDIASTFISVLTICYICRFSQKFALLCMAKGGGYRHTNDTTDSELGSKYPNIVISEASSVSMSSNKSLPAQYQPQTGSQTVKELQEQSRQLQAQFSRLHQEHSQLQPLS